MPGQGSARFASLKVAELLPDGLGNPTEGAELLQGLAGCRIRQIGTSIEPGSEGRWLVLDYWKPGEDKLRRAVFGFNDRAIWSEFDGPVE